VLVGGRRFTSGMGGRCRADILIAAGKTREIEIVGWLRDPDENMISV
jgi:hypothetical protein